MQCYVHVKDVVVVTESSRIHQGLSHKILSSRKPLNTQMNLHIAEKKLKRDVQYARAAWERDIRCPHCARWFLMQLLLECSLLCIFYRSLVQTFLAGQRRLYFCLEIEVAFLKTQVSHHILKSTSVSSELLSYLYEVFYFHL